MKPILFLPLLALAGCVAAKPWIPPIAPPEVLPVLASPFSPKPPQARFEVRMHWKWRGSAIREESYFLVPRTTGQPHTNASAGVAVESAAYVDRQGNPGSSNTSTDLDCSSDPWRYRASQGYFVGKESRTFDSTFLITPWQNHTYQDGDLTIVVRFSELIPGAGVQRPR